MSGPSAVQKVFTVPLRLGLHARPATVLVSMLNRYRCKAQLSKGEVAINGKSIMGVMMLAAEQGSQLKVSLEGPDASQALEEVGRLFDHWRKDPEEKCPSCKGTA